MFDVLFPPWRRWPAAVRAMAPGDGWLPVAAIIAALGTAFNVHMLGKDIRYEKREKRHWHGPAIAGRPD